MSWRQLLDIYEEADADRRAEEAAPPEACPNCGEPLELVRGVLHCRFDGWTDR